jgi:hypothetical protein
MFDHASATKEALHGNTPNYLGFPMIDAMR